MPEKTKFEHPSLTKIKLEHHNFQQFGRAPESYKNQSLTHIETEHQGLTIDKTG